MTETDRLTNRQRDSEKETETDRKREKERDIYRERKRERYIARERREIYIEKERKNKRDSEKYIYFL